MTSYILNGFNPLLILKIVNIVKYGEEEPEVNFMVKFLLWYRLCKWTDKYMLRLLSLKKNIIDFLQFPAYFFFFLIRKTNKSQKAMKPSVNFTDTFF